MRTVDPSTWSKKKLKLGVKPSWQRAQGLEARLRRSFCDAFQEYLSHCSIKGVWQSRDHRINKHLRRCYGILILLVMAWGTVGVFVAVYRFRMRPPLQVNVQANTYSPSVTFPAVAICSNCIVSNKALQEYTDELVAKDNNLTYTKAEIKNFVKNFGAMINLSRLKYENLQFLRFLYKIDSAFNITDLMYKLAPKCSSMLKKCWWRGRDIDCKMLFAERVTPLGFCCVFNSRYDAVDARNLPQTLDAAGQNFGLSVAVREDMEDISVIRRPSVGFQVLIFEGSEYPLMESGAVRSYSVGLNASVFFQLTAHVQLVAHNLHRYSEKWRGCRISKTAAPRSEFSSYPWCLTYCRKYTTLAVCNCVPFYLPSSAADPVCTTEHLQCLFKHREKLVYYYPGKVQDSSLDEELQDSQTCTKCIPDCARLQYTANVFHTYYYYPGKLLKNRFSSSLSLYNTTILRFYYATNNHEVYNVEINVNAYEVFAYISCHIWFTLGTSFVCMAELVFHLTFRWTHHFWRRTRRTRRLA